jgi:CheY-like chemotaxis protein
VSQTISAIASLLWPLIVLAVLVLFRGPLTRVIRSTEARDFTIKIAGQEVSVGELHRQQMDMMADLHDQITALRKDFDALPQRGPAKISASKATTQDSPKSSVTAHAAAPATAGAAASTGSQAGGTTFDETDTELAQAAVPSQDRPQFHADPVKAPWERLEHLVQNAEPADDKEPAAAAESNGTAATLSVVPAESAEVVPNWAGQHPDTRPKAAGVLWVDDHPERNALQVDQLERRGVVVDAVRSTKEALQKLTGQRYQLIVSDMERVENGKPAPGAGLELIRTVRTFDRDTPVVIFASGPGGKVLADTAAQIGADLVTNSWYQLTQEMHRIGVL